MLKVRRHSNPGHGVSLLLQWANSIHKMGSYLGGHICQKTENLKIIIDRVRAYIFFSLGQRQMPYIIFKELPEINNSSLIFFKK